MTEFDWQAKKLAAQCPELSVGVTHEELLHTINTLFAPLKLSFEKVLERGGWHHLQDSAEPLPELPEERHDARRILPVLRRKNQKKQ